MTGSFENTDPLGGVPRVGHPQQRRLVLVLERAAHEIEQRAPVRADGVAQLALVARAAPRGSPACAARPASSPARSDRARTARCRPVRRACTSRPSPPGLAARRAGGRRGWSRRSGRPGAPRASAAPSSSAAAARPAAPASGPAARPCRRRRQSAAGNRSAALAFCFICDQIALTPAVWQATSTARSRASPMVSLTTRQTSRNAPVGSTPCAMSSRMPVRLSSTPVRQVKKIGIDAVGQEVGRHRPGCA